MGFEQTVTIHDRGNGAMLNPRVKVIGIHCRKEAAPPGQPKLIALLQADCLAEAKEPPRFDYRNLP